MVGAVLMLGAGLGVAAAETGGTGAPAVQCPVVADRLPPVPAAAQAEVTRNLALLNLQVAEANQRLETNEGRGGPNFVATEILAPLVQKRRATIDEIATTIGREAERPAGLESLAACRVTPGGVGGAPEPTEPRPTTPSIQEGSTESPGAGSPAAESPGAQSPGVESPGIGSPAPIAPAPASPGIPTRS